MGDGSNVDARSVVGNSLDNIITVINKFGYPKNDVIDGGAGADTMSAGFGDDTYYVDNVGDVVIEGVAGGIDTIITTSSYNLSTNAANVENITLVGSGLSVIGNAWNNTYTISDTSDIVIEAAGGGIDTIQSSVTYGLALGSSIENLILTGAAAINATGNELNNVLRGDGNTAANILAGGLGNDTYYVGVGDTIIENAGEGIDTVAVVDWAVQSYTLGANLENLTMGNGSAAPARTAVGNALDNIITLINKNGSSDVIDGGAGADTMSAGLADDTYYVDNVGDVVIENAGGGVDTIISSTSYTLSANVENMTLVGAGLTATGNAWNNIYTINDANNSVIEAVGGGIDTIKVQ